MYISLSMSGPKSWSNSFLDKSALASPVNRSMHARTVAETTNDDVTAQEGEELKEGEVEEAEGAVKKKRKGPGFRDRKVSAGSVEDSSRSEMRRGSCPFWPMFTSLTGLWDTSNNTLAVQEDGSFPCPSLWPHKTVELNCEPGHLIKIQRLLKFTIARHGIFNWVNLIKEYCTPN